MNGSSESDKENKKAPERVMPERICAPKHKFSTKDTRTKLKDLETTKAERVWLECGVVHVSVMAISESTR